MATAGSRIVRWVAPSAMGVHKTDMHVFPQQQLVAVLMVQHTDWRNGDGGKIVPTFYQAALRAFGNATAAQATSVQIPGQPASVLPNLNTLTVAEKAAGWQLLFDGKSTTGWRNFRKATISSGWRVIDGALCRIDKTAGDIITVGQYDNFVLELDYKVPPHANSGIMYHVSENEDRAPSPAWNTRFSTTAIPRAIRRSRAGPIRSTSHQWTPRPASRWMQLGPSASGTTSS